MNNKDIPTWQKIMQNGSLAEARARAFLLNRFWILERSMDIDGADLIIQRRLNQANILDVESPRLGVVQVKYFASNKTEHQIHQEYILDNDGFPRKEFFILLHTGDEDSSEMYFLTAAHLHENFKTRMVKKSLKYILAGKEVFGNPRYKISNNKLVLDRMEHQLKLADFNKNRKFLSWNLPVTSFDIDNIEQDYKEPIPNWQTPIPEGFQKLKKAIYDSLIDISEIFDQLKTVSETSDPIVAIEIINKLRRDCDRGNHWSIPLPNELEIYEFENACRIIKSNIDSLKANNLLDKFLALRGYFKREILKYLSDKPLNDINLVHSISFTVGNEFQIVELENRLDDSHTFIKRNKEIHEDTIKRSLNVVLISRNKFLAYWTPAIMLSLYNSNNNLETYFKADQSNIDELCYLEILNERYSVTDYADGTRF